MGQIVFLLLLVGERKRVYGNSLSAIAAIASLRRMQLVTSEWASECAVIDRWTDEIQPVRQV